MSPRRVPMSLAALLIVGWVALVLTPTAAADPVCTPYTGSGQTMSHACVDPTNDHCWYWTSGWVGSSPFYVCWVPAPEP